MRLLATVPTLVALGLALHSGWAWGQGRGTADRGEAPPTLAQVMRQTAATENPGLAEAPPEKADGRVYLLTGVLLDQIDAVRLVKLGEGYWAYRTTDDTRENVVGLRPGDTIAVVGKFVQVATLPRPGGTPAPTAVLEALYLTNDESQIPGAG